MVFMAFEIRVCIIYFVFVIRKGLKVELNSFYKSMILRGSFVSFNQTFNEKILIVRVA